MTSPSPLTSAPCRRIAWIVSGMSCMVLRIVGLPPQMSSTTLQASCRLPPSPSSERRRRRLPGMDAELRSLSRKAWGDLETLHVVGYFAPEVTEEYVDLGLHPQLAYFPGRAAAFGEAGPGLTVATFYVFAPWLVEAALPAAWQTTTPEVVAARRTGLSRALGKTLGTPDVSEALAIARCAALSPQGRPLFVAHRRAALARG